MRHLIDPERSTVIVAARSSMGPIVFESQGLDGWIEADIVDCTIQTSPPPRAWLSIRLDSLSSGNDVYDAELRRRIDTRVFPTCDLELERAEATVEDRYVVEGNVTFHGVTRILHGSVTLECPRPGRMVISGQKLLDLRDFDIPPPGILMMKIYPDVDIRLFAEVSVEETEASP